MKTIYKAPMKRLVVSKLDVKDGAIKLLEFDTPVIKKDLLFYRNRLNAYISFDYGTRLPNQMEAMDYVKDWIQTHERFDSPYPTCPFVDEEDFEVHNTVDNHNFRALKTYYKNLRKAEKKK